MAKNKLKEPTVSEPKVETTEPAVEQTVETPTEQVAEEVPVAGHPSRDFYSAL